MPFTNSYDVTFPPDTELANLLGNNLRSLALNVQQRMAAISGISTAMPNFAADAQPANWTGILFFATDNGHIYQFNGTTWVDITVSFIKTVGFVKYTQAVGTNPVVIPANTLAVGSVIELVGSAGFGGTSAGSMQLTANGSNLSTINLPSQSSGSPPRPVCIGVILICQSLGSSGSFGLFTNAYVGSGTFTVGNPSFGVVLDTTNPISIAEVLVNNTSTGPLAAIVNT
jgi:hypothetical protein